MAYMEAKIACIKVLKRFNLKLSPGHHVPLPPTLSSSYEVWANNCFGKIGRGNESYCTAC